MKDKTISKLKDEFHKWCGLLTVSEIMRNKILISAIEEIEKKLIHTSL